MALSVCRRLVSLNIPLVYVASLFIFCIKLSNVEWIIVNISYTIVPMYGNNVVTYLQVCSCLTNTSCSFLFITEISSKLRRGNMFVRHLHKRKRKRLKAPTSCIRNEEWQWSPPSTTWK